MDEDVKPLTMYHDGACPLCQAEVVLLKQRSRRGQIRFVDVRDVAFENESGAPSRERALGVMHGRIGDGKLLQGVDVMAAAYQRTDLSVMSWLLSRPAIRPFLDAAYRIFATHRKTISRVFGPLMLRLARARHPHCS